MSITAELRQYTKHYSVAGSKKDTMLSSIADRIDAEHERAEQDLIEANNQLEQLCECSIEMPVDADGEVIHVGDTLVSRYEGRDYVREVA